MNHPDPLDGTAGSVVSGDAAPSPRGVPAPTCPQEATGPASLESERDAAPGPRSEMRSSSGDQATPGLSGQAARDAIRKALAEQARRQRTARGKYTRIADRQPGGSYRPGGNRRGGQR